MLSILPEKYRICSDLDCFGFIKYKQNLNEILNISGNIDIANKADHILEMSRLEEFGDYCFKL